MPLTPEQRETLNMRREQVRQELDEMAAGTRVDYADKTERRQELLDELDEISRSLGEIEPEE